MGMVCGKKIEYEDVFTGLSTREKELITKTWSLLPDMIAMELTGVELFRTLFKKNPDFVHYFPKGINEPSETDVQANVVLRAHALTVMVFLKACVDCINDFQLLSALVEKMARQHSRAGVDPGSFVAVKDTFHELMLEKFGPSIYHEDMRIAWDKFFLFIEATVSQIENDKSKVVFYGEEQGNFSSTENQSDLKT